MEHFHGFLGVFDQAEHQDLTAVGCRDATVGILKELCSPSSPVPYKSDPLDMISRVWVCSACQHYIMGHNVIVEPL